MAPTIRQGLSEDGFEVLRARLCRWFGIARRTAYYRPTKAPPAVKVALAEPVKALTEEEPSFGYRTVAGLLGVQKEHGAEGLPAQGGRQIRKHAIGQQPRIQVLPSVAQAKGLMSVGQPAFAASGAVGMAG